jgi:hypothetical protein
VPLLRPSQVGNNSVLATLVSDLFGDPDALELLPLCFTRWTRQHSQMRMHPAAPGSAGAATRWQADAAASAKGQLSLAAFPRTEELVHLVRMSSVVATETPLMVGGPVQTACMLPPACSGARACIGRPACQLLNALGRACPRAGTAAATRLAHLGRAPPGIDSHLFAALSVHARVVFDTVGAVLPHPQPQPQPHPGLHLCRCCTSMRAA